MSLNDPNLIADSNAWSTLSASVPVLADTGPLTQGLRWLTGQEQAYFASEHLGWLVAIMIVAGAILLWWSYRSSGLRPSDRTIGMVLKGLAITFLVFFVLEPMNVTNRPTPGENVLIVLTDDSKSLRISDSGATQTRGETLIEAIEGEQDWLESLDRSFDVRRYQFNARVQAVNDFELTFEGNRTNIADSLEDVSARLGHRPIAGIILLTDGNGGSISSEELARLDLPPVYPVQIGKGMPERDLHIERVSVNQTNFEAAPISIVAEYGGVGHDGKRVTLSVIDPQGKVVDSKTAVLDQNAAANIVRFQIQPEDTGVLFYDVLIQTEDDFKREGNSSNKATEATLENNRLTAVVDRGGGPYRVLYVSGRPNWEYKYLRRAVVEDPETKLTGLLRIAKREPKFSFRSRSGESTNPLFRGFDRTDEETAQYDQPVFLRIDPDNEQELREGFPKAPEDLFKFDAIILDDTESEFFTHEQLQLLKRFVTDRGGGLVMLGGTESFGQGVYRNTPIEDLLPIYLDNIDDRDDSASYQLDLSRDGWLQPWVRLRRNESDERLRIDSMPEFLTLNRVGRIKPGAEQLAFVRDANGVQYPALVTQSFGQGRVGAVLIGDLWRWEMHRPDPAESDLQTAWRQVVRWLVADVPRRVELDVDDDDVVQTGRVNIRALVRDELFEPMDNSSVRLTLTDPDGTEFMIDAEPSDTEPGVYVAEVSSRTAGAYRASFDVRAPDGSLIGEREAGWTASPDYFEFGQLSPDEETLARIATVTEGKVYALTDLASLADDLPNKPAPVMETIKYPIWHRASLFLLAIACLVLEWGWRRLRGAP